MEKERKYKFEYSPLILSLIIILNIITLIGTVLNGIRLKDYAKLTVPNKIALIIILCLSAFLLIVSLCLFFRRYYKVVKENLVLRVSIFTFRVKIENISDITYLKRSEKLCIREKDGKYFFPIISPKSYSDFVSELIRENPEIVYSPEEE